MASDTARILSESDRVRQLADANITQAAGDTSVVFNAARDILRSRGDNANAKRLSDLGNIKVDAANGETVRSFLQKRMAELSASDNEGGMLGADIAGAGALDVLDRNLRENAKSAAPTFDSGGKAIDYRGNGKGGNADPSVNKTIAGMERMRKLYTLGMNDIMTDDKGKFAPSGDMVKTSGYTPRQFMEFELAMATSNKEIAVTDSDGRIRKKNFNSLSLPEQHAQARKYMSALAAHAKATGVDRNRPMPEQMAGIDFTETPDQIKTRSGGTQAAVSRYSASGPEYQDALAQADIATDEMRNLRGDPEMRTRGQNEALAEESVKYAAANNTTVDEASRRVRTRWQSSSNSVAGRVTEQLALRKQEMIQDKSWDKDDERSVARRKGIEQQLSRAERGELVGSEKDIQVAAEALGYKGGASALSDNVHDSRKSAMTIAEMQKRLNPDRFDAGMKEATHTNLVANSNQATKRTEASKSYAGTRAAEDLYYKSGGEMNNKTNTRRSVDTNAATDKASKDAILGFINSDDSLTTEQKKKNSRAVEDAFNDAKSVAKSGDSTNTQAIENLMKRNDYMRNNAPSISRASNDAGNRELVQRARKAQAADPEAEKTLREYGDFESASSDLRKQFAGDKSKTRLSATLSKIAGDSKLSITQKRQAVEKVMNDATKTGLKGERAELTAEQRDDALDRAKEVGRRQLTDSAAREAAGSKDATGLVEGERDRIANDLSRKITLNEMRNTGAGTAEELERQKRASENGGKPVTNAEDKRAQNERRAREEATKNDAVNTANNMAANKDSILKKATDQLYLDPKSSGAGGFNGAKEPVVTIKEGTAIRIIDGKIARDGKFTQRD
jgi:hypothetical protein